MLKKLLAAAGAALAITMVGSVAASAPATPPPPISAYGQLPGLDQVTISPDGTRLAFIGQVGDKRRLGVKGLNGQDLANVELGDVKIRSISWLDDNHVVIVRSTTTDRFSEFGELREAFNGQIYNVEKRTFANVLSTVRGVGSSRTGDDQVLNLFSGYYTRVIGGQRVMLVTAAKTGANMLFRIDPDTGGGTPFIRDYHGGLLDAAGKVYAEEQADFELGRWRVTAVEGPTRREVFNWDGGRGVVSWPSLLGPGRSPNTVIISGPEGVDKDEVLYETNLADGAKKKLSFPGHGDYSPIYDDTTGDLLGFGAEVGDGFDRIYTNEAAARAWATLKVSFPTGFVQVQDRTQDYSKIIVRTEGDNDSGTFLLIDIAAGKAIRIGSAYPGVPGSAVNERRWITYKAADGMDIPAYLTLPRGRDPHNLPLIVLPHGGPAARDEPGFDWWSQALASRGYVVLQPEFRGSRGFGEAHMAAGYGQWGKKMQTDLSDGVRYLAAQGIIDPKRVCIFGWSYGGYAAMAGPAIDPGIYRCAVAGAGVSDLNKMLAWERDRTGGKDSIAVRFWKRFMGASRINDGSLDQVSPAKQANRVQVPILLIHGAQDYTVPVEQSQIYADALKRAGKDVTLVVLPNDDHYIDARSASRQRVFELAIEFLEKNNPPYP